MATKIAKFAGCLRESPRKKLKLYESILKKAIGNGCRYRGLLIMLERDVLEKMGDGKLLLLR